MLRFRTSEAAKADIRDIERYSRSAFGARAAGEYLRGLRGVFDRIVERPLAGAVVRQFADDLRSVGYRAHRIYYRMEGAEDLVVIRVLHQAPDAASILSDPQ